MEKVKQILFYLTVVLIISGNTSAQKVGSTSMQFLNVLPSARAAAMGNAYAALGHGAEGVFWNPAGVALSEAQEFSTTYISWLFDAKQYALAYSIPVEGLGSFGIQFQYIDYGGFDEAIVSGGNMIYPGQELPYLTGRVFKPYSYIAGLSYAVKLTDHFSTGLTVKYGYESLYDQKQVTVVGGADNSGLNVNTYGNALLFDFGVHYNTGFRSVQIGASVQNFGADIKYAIDKSTVPMLFRFGVAANLIGVNSLLVNNSSNRIGVAFDIFQSNDYDQQQHFGLEYEFAETFALRGGYKLNYDLEGLTFGAGIKQNLSSIKLSFDYSYGVIGSVAGSFGNIHRISLGVGIL